MPIIDPTEEQTTSSNPENNGDCENQIVIAGRTAQEIRDLMAEYRAKNIKFDYANVSDDVIDDILIHYMRFIDGILDADLTANIQVALERMIDQNQNINVTIVNNYYGMGEVIMITIQQVQDEHQLTRSHIDTKFYDTIGHPGSTLMVILNAMNSQGSRVENTVNQHTVQLSNIMTKLDQVTIGGVGSVQTPISESFELNPSNNKTFFIAENEELITATIDLKLPSKDINFRIFVMPYEEDVYDFILWFWDETGKELSAEQIVDMNISFIGPNGTTQNIESAMDIGAMIGAPEKNIFLVEFNGYTSGMEGFELVPTTEWDPEFLSGVTTGFPIVITPPSTNPTLDYRGFEVVTPPEHGGTTSHILMYFDEAGKELTIQEILDKHIVITTPDGIERTIIGLQDMGVFSGAPDNNILLMQLDPHPEGQTGMPLPPSLTEWSPELKESEEGIRFPIEYEPELENDNRLSWYIEQQGEGKVEVVFPNGHIVTPENTIAKTNGIDSVLKITRIGENTVSVTGGKFVWT